MEYGTFRYLGHKFDMFVTSEVGDFTHLVGSIKGNDSYKQVHHISLRLLALILCSNCSNTFNKVLTIIDGHLLNYFLNPGGSLVLALHPPCMVLAFHALP